MRFAQRGVRGRKRRGWRAHGGRRPAAARWLEGAAGFQRLLQEQADRWQLARSWRLWPVGGTERAQERQNLVDPYRTGTDRTFDAQCTVRIVCICRVVYPGPRCIPVGEEHDVHDARPVFELRSDSVRARGRRLVKTALKKELPRARTVVGKAR